LLLDTLWMELLKVMSISTAMIHTPLASIALIHILGHPGIFQRISILHTNSKVHRHSTHLMSFKVVRLIHGEVW
jgi:hypothetical protein